MGTPRLPQAPPHFMRLRQPCLEDIIQVRENCFHEKISSGCKITVFPHFETNNKCCKKKFDFDTVCSIQYVYLHFLFSFCLTHSFFLGYNHFLSLHKFSFNLSNVGLSYTPGKKNNFREFLPLDFT